MTNIQKNMDLIKKYISRKEKTGKIMEIIKSFKENEYLEDKD